MKPKSKISDYIIRTGAWAVLFSVGFIALSWAFDSVGAIGGYDAMAKFANQPRTFSFAERVAFQRAIEDVYWRHRIWPKENPDPKPSLDAVMSQAQLENKVADYLGHSQALEDYWHRPITAEQLQAEMDRMARDTKQPEVLQELFEALRNDPAVIAECLARQVLAERLITDSSVQGETWQPKSPQTDGLRAMSVGTLGQVVYTLPGIPDTGDPPCTNLWAATTTANAPLARDFHTAVWTGSEMIVWGGYHQPSDLNTGGKYNPSTDSWIATSLTNAPTARFNHTAVWTGSEMIVWGGFSDISFLLNTGGRYNPSTNSWTATSTTNAPSARSFHTAVWTGSEMIVWGGEDYGLNIGGRYNPGTNSWTATSTTNAPTARSGHTAVWTGSEMIVWGGSDVFGDVLNTGGRYNPSTNSWTATSTTNAPAGRFDHTAVWTGTEMIVWGGASFSIDLSQTGGRYNPGTDSWIATSTTNAPTGRWGHTAIWTGSEMIVWGGVHGSYLNTGGKYCAQPGEGGEPGATAIWYLNNNIFIGSASGPSVSSGWQVIGVADFNRDGHPDYVLFNPTTRATVIWYMNNNVHVGSNHGPTLPGRWLVAGVADFNLDGHPDYLLFNPTTRATVVWYMNNNVHVGGNHAPTITPGWSLLGAADFNGDGKPDYLLFKSGL